MSRTHSPETVPVQPLKVAIVHDWLVGGGAERVVAELHKLFPDAPIYTSYCSDEWRKRLDGKVVTGFLQRWPFGALRKYVGILRIWWFTHLDLSAYDLVISSSGNGEAKSIRTPKTTTHICYCHAPTHFYWRHYEQYVQHPGFGVFDPLARLGLRLLVAPLRGWDYKAAQRPDYFLANSAHTQAEIKQFYGRDATVIHPPVDTKRFATAQPQQRRGFVWAGRQVPAKRVDILIAACNKLHVPLTIIGRGPDHDRLVQLAGPTIQFLTVDDDAALPGYFATAEAFLFPSYEDFGVTPVEAMAAGTPVIAFKAGGALDYVIEGKTGLFFAHQAADSLVETLKIFDGKRFDHAAIQKHALTFSTAAFEQHMRSFIGTVMQK